MSRRRKKPAEINYTNIVKLAFTHQGNRGKSIRSVADLLGMNPGTVYRILKRLGFVDSEDQHAQLTIASDEPYHSDHIDRDKPGRRDKPKLDNGKKKKRSEDLPYHFEILNRYAPKVSKAFDIDFDWED